MAQVWWKILEESFESRMVGVAHGLGVLDPKDSPELIGGIQGGVSRDQWLARQQRRAWMRKIGGL